MLKPGGARAVLRRFRGDCGAGRIQLIPFGADITAEAERIATLAFAHRIGLREPRFWLLLMHTSGRRGQR